MQDMRKNFEDCNAVIQGEDDTLLGNVKILEHDTASRIIEVDNILALGSEKLCNVLILTAPLPSAYKGRISKRAGRTYISLFKESSVENRQDVRHKVDLPASIEGFICNGKAYPLHTPVNTRILNISRGGLRMRTVFNALLYGDQFQLRIKSGEMDLPLTARVIRRDDTAQQYSEFSCRLINEEGGGIA